MNIIVRYAKESDLDKITKVHMECFPDYFSTHLGKSLLKGFYKEYLKKFPHLFVVAVDEENEEIVGLTNGYVIGQNIRNEFIKNNYLKLLLRGIFLLVTFDKVAWEKVGKFFKKSKDTNVNSNKSKDGEGDLLSICTLPSYRGSGASKKMVEKFEEGLKELGIDTYYLSVFSDNERAKSFYEKCRFEVFNENSIEVKYKKVI